jgi:hypothetical protein
MGEGNPCARSHKKGGIRLHSKLLLNFCPASCRVGPRSIDDVRDADGISLYGTFFADIGRHGELVGEPTSPEQSDNNAGIRVAAETGLRGFGNRGAGAEILSPYTEQDEFEGRIRAKWRPLAGPS